MKYTPFILLIIIVGAMVLFPIINRTPKVIPKVGEVWRSKYDTTGVKGQDRFIPHIHISLSDFLASDVKILEISPKPGEVWIVTKPFHNTITIDSIDRFNCVRFHWSDNNGRHSVVCAIEHFEGKKWKDEIDTGSLGLITRSGKGHFWHIDSAVLKQATK